MKTLKVKGSIWSASVGPIITWEDTTDLLIDCPDKQEESIACLSYTIIMAARCKAYGKFPSDAQLTVMCEK